MVILGSLAKRIPFLYISKTYKVTVSFHVNPFTKNLVAYRIEVKTSRKQENQIDFRDCDYTGKIE